jgi:alpha-beta hydrolase superfamily lysophospholipase
MVPSTDGAPSGPTAPDAARPDVAGGRDRSRRRTRHTVQIAVAVATIAAVTFGVASAGHAKAKRHARQSGTIITSTVVSASGVDGTAHLVKYWSMSARNRPQSVTGIVYVPYGTAPAGGWPVVSYAHPTNGMADECAPSLDPSNDVPAINDMLDNGWEVTATDYQGEGNQSLGSTTRGLQPHGVNIAEAHNVIDIVRAAQDVPGADPSSDYVTWGHSEGGGASIFSLELAASYAPDLHLLGAVASAPASDLADDFFGAPSDGASPFTLMYVAGYHAAYGNQVPLSLLTGTGRWLDSQLGHECYDQTASEVDPYQVDQVFTTTTVPANFARELDANDPLHLTTRSASPLLVVQGLDDTNDTPSDTQAMDDHLCDLGQDVVQWMYPGLDHNSIVTGSADDVVHWIADRFAGQSNPDSYAPGDAQTSSCN